jgi:signal transduction histidine kinase
VERIYPTIVETVALTLKLPYTAIAVRRGDRFETVESYGRPVDDPVNFALTHQGEIVGQLQVALRARDEPFSALDERLIRSIARQAGAVVHAVQLTADLQRSRRQLVTSREEERRRLRRDLHDGLGPSLASLMLKIGSARAILHDDTQAAESLLAEMEADVESTLAEVRRVVYNLRPPELDQLGLMGAIEACARSYVADSERDQPVVTVVGPVSIPTMPAAVEIAAYRIVQEGLTNVMRHAQANQCAVSLAFEPASRNNEGRLIVTIRDDGLGLPGNISPGVGLVSMRERATELGGVCEIEPALGGGTLVRAVLPVQEIGD